MKKGKYRDIIFDPNKTYEGHYLVVGSTGTGKSTTLATLAQSLNIQGKKFEIKHPTEEEINEAKKIRQEQEQERRNKEQQQLLKTKTTWIDNLDDYYDLHSFQEATSHYLEIEEVTDEQVYKIFLLIDGYLFGQGICWGFSDTEVRSNIWEWVEENKEEIERVIK